MSGLRIAYVGNFEPRHSTENHVAQELTALGNQVVSIQENSAERGDAFEVLMAPTSLLLVTRSWGWEPAEWLRDLIAFARDRGIPSAGFHLDRFWGLGDDRIRRVETDPMFRTDAVFTADGDDDAAFKERGINHVWLPPGVLTSECYDAPPFVPGDTLGEHGVDYSRALSAQVAFVGSYNYHPEWPHRPEMIDMLRDWYGDRFLFVGGDGDLPTTRDHDLNRLYATVPVIVGDYCFARTDARYWSDRFPETWGRGGFLIYPNTKILQEELLGATDYGYPSWSIGDWDTLRFTVDFFLDNPDLRDENRERIAAYVRKAQTYQARLSWMLDQLGLS